MEAIAEYQDAIKLAPKQAGTEYEKAGKLDLAEAALQEELGINPHNVLARYKLGTLEIERGEGTKRKELVEGAVQLDPSLKNSSYYLGRAEMELANSAAAESFERTVSATGADRELVRQAWYQLGIAYRRLLRGVCNIPEAGGRRSPKTAGTPQKETRSPRPRHRASRSPNRE